MAREQRGGNDAAQQLGALTTRLDAHAQRPARAGRSACSRPTRPTACCATNCSASASAPRCSRTASPSSPIPTATAHRRCAWTKPRCCWRSATQRLQIAGDLDGARRAYALAAGVLDGIDDPAYLSLRQTLPQERAALDALGADPRVQAIGATGRLRAAPCRRAAARRRDAARPRDRGGAAPSARFVEVQPSDRAVAVQPADRAAALAALQLEISLARAAAERRDEAGYRAALRRADAWLPRLWPDSPALRAAAARNCGRWRRCRFHSRVPDARQHPAATAAVARALRSVSDDHPRSPP